MERLVDPAEICTLPPADLAGRLAWIRSEIAPHAAAVERLGDGLALELERRAGLEEKLDQLVRLEAGCCASIRFERVASAHPGRLRLEIHGADPDAEVFRGLA